MKEFFNHLVSVNSHEKLFMKKGKLSTENGTELYDVVMGVPIMLLKEAKAKWLRELIEIIFWKYPDEIEEIYKELEKADDYLKVYIAHINRRFKSKKEILDAFDDYSRSETDKWLTKKYDAVITNAQKREFLKYSFKSNGRTRTKTKINANGIFTVYPFFSRKVNENSPEKILELGTGAGGGTAATALLMSKSSVLYTVDIGFHCLGNAIGIRKYQKKNIIPVCADFRYLPFADESFDSACTFNGLDESRENGSTIKEISRILKQGGTFTVVSREKANMRQSAVLEPFGFSNEEINDIMKKCRAFSDIDSLEELCKNHGLIIASQEKFDCGNNLIRVLTQFVKA